ncbi:hypothetical protein K504DRAFT_518672 [Pleomassaria siparia CBS 279.74]|uniref:Uncharacterized protein n=1 Tax=Pleomassaria siparia CBS 279.74 TaxID=1314801 RepID=A0A6G1JV52_9PLEO|nr:hypothetical protein K504DRAFT_518672 [Pleomassaria siparia CBS 279.74]
MSTDLTILPEYLFGSVAPGPGPTTQLHLPVSRNRGGLILPQLSDQSQYSLYNCLQRFLSHAWHFNAPFPDANTPLGPETFLYLVVDSTWYTNPRFLDRDIEHIGFNEIRNPNAAINNRLHDRRQDLISLREQVELASKWIPQSVNDELNAIKAVAQKEQSYIGCPNQLFSDILRRSELLENFLMDSFNLLISSTSKGDQWFAVIDLAICSSAWHHRGDHGGYFHRIHELAKSSSAEEQCSPGVFPYEEANFHKIKCSPLQQSKHGAFITLITLVLIHVACLCLECQAYTSSYMIASSCTKKLPDFLPGELKFDGSKLMLYCSEVPMRSNTSHGLSGGSSFPALVY